mmetsp:Transcript_6301/g.13211  ORF Transcript_6301/g.13211 Transcript_6301/m.13211 type:complete len:688 (-) Transcript_6301:342-2405(-)
MPIYLCRPGGRFLHSWKATQDVYARPIPLPPPGGTADRPGDEGGGTSAAHAVLAAALPPPAAPDDADADGDADGDAAPAGGRSPAPPRRDAVPVVSSALPPPRAVPPRPAEEVPVRKVRHSEVLLVDNVSVEYGRYWLRLRWPGPEAGFAGYISPCVAPKNPPRVPDPVVETDDAPSKDSALDQAEGSSEVSFASNAAGEDDPDEAPSTPAAPCGVGGLCYPTTDSMELLPDYDDGLQPDLLDVAPSSGADLQPVFCRICREGLHDVLHEPQPEGTRPADPSLRDHPTVRNPLLAPCECRGSMAFVHYLCVEQWRCRSRHPEARGGLACETCQAPYTLPPPPARPAGHGEGVGERDWLDAMPPHVLAALRRPHLWWRVGAAVARRPWLRPIAPVLVSPAVSLYCRARRMLKKRGVSRRRWACSLCRRRARWKCVRCLRSYYCSRQCQNVSWHIVHKHVCYKPGRFCWSVFVYSVGTLLALPGIRTDPLVYAAGTCLFPACFFAVGVIGGAIASAVKKTTRVDLRGRWLELLVVMTTLAMVYLSWGVVWGFFGTPEYCVGILGVDEQQRPLAAASWSLVLRPLSKILLGADKMLARYGPALRICAEDAVPGEWCTAGIAKISPGFMTGGIGNGCGGDATVLVPAWVAAAAVVAFDVLFRKRGRRAGRGAVAGGRRAPGGGAPVRPHAD